MAKDTLKPKEELFCRLYGTPGDLFGVGYKCYAQAYGIDLLSGNEKVRKKRNAVCRNCASVLLTKPNIKAYLNKLLDDLWNEQDVDRETSWTIQQRKDLGAKMRAVSEFNKVKARIVEKKEVLHTGAVLTNVNDEKYKKFIDRERERFNKGTGDSRNGKK